MTVTKTKYTRRAKKNYRDVKSTTEKYKLQSAKANQSNIERPFFLFS